MIKLLFSKGKTNFIITIDNKKVLYWDALEGHLWGGSIQYLPPCAETKRKIILSRNKIPMEFIQLIDISKKDYEEYLKCETDEQIKTFVLEDALSNGCVLEEERIE